MSEYQRWLLEVLLLLAAEEMALECPPGSDEEAALHMAYLAHYTPREAAQAASQGHDPLVPAAVLLAR